MARSPDAGFLRSGFVRETVVKALDSPTAFAIASDGRIFITQKAGTVKIFRKGKLLRENFIDLSAEVNQAFNRGLVGIALHPRFPTVPYVYLSYVYQPPEANKNKPSGAGCAGRPCGGQPNRSQPRRPGLHGGAAWRRGTYAQIGNPDTPNAQPLTCLMPNGSAAADCIPVEGTAHQTDALQFGPDGTLYARVGDGGETAQKGFRSQDINSLSGKILRIDPETGKGLHDNPFYDGNADSNRSKVFAYGLRNPFRFTFAPSGRELYVADVGEGKAEEINRAGRGANFGWPCLEGAAVAGSYPACAAVVENRKSLTFPFYVYPHTEGRVAVVGGDFYHGTGFPEQYRNAYFFADYNVGMVWALVTAGQSASVEDFAGGFSGVVQITSGPDAALYVLSIRRVRLRASAMPADGLSPRLRYSSEKAHYTRPLFCATMDWPVHLPTYNAKEPAMSTLPPGPYESIPCPGAPPAPFYMLPFDKRGVCVAPGTRAHLLEDAAAGRYTDIFVFSHGWNNDWPSALSAYRSFIANFAAMVRSRRLALPAPFRPLLIGIYWPSAALTFGDEDAPAMAAETGEALDQAAAAATDRVRDLAEDLPAENAARFYTLLQKERLDAAETAELVQLAAPFFTGSAGSADLPEGEEFTPAAVAEAWLSLPTPSTRPFGSFGTAGGAPAELPAAQARPARWTSFLTRASRYAGLRSTR